MSHTALSFYHLCRCGRWSRRKQASYLLVLSLLPSGGSYSSGSATSNGWPTRSSRSSRASSESIMSRSLAAAPCWERWLRRGRSGLTLVVLSWRFGRPCSVTLTCSRAGTPCGGRLWQAVARGNKVDEYARIKASYNAHPNGADLLFLCRSCYGGVVRFRQRDGYMSTPCAVHKPMPPSEFVADRLLRTY
jgi:hypothetical protein